MFYLTEIESPVGLITLASDGEHLNGAWIKGQKYLQQVFPKRLNLKMICWFSAGREIGSMIILTERSRVRISFLFAPREAISGKRYGKYFAESHTEN